MLAVRENRYIVLAKDFEKAYKTVIKKDEQEHEFYKQKTQLDISISFYPVCFSLYLYVQCNVEDITLDLNLQGLYCLYWDFDFTGLLDLHYIKYGWKTNTHLVSILCILINEDERLPQRRTLKFFP